MKKLMRLSSVLLGSILMFGMTAQAELIDNSNTHTHTGLDSKVTASSNQNATQNRSARLLRNPLHRGRNHTNSSMVFRHLPTCDCNEKGQPLPLDSCRRQQINMTVAMVVDEQGEVVEASLDKNSGIAALDRAIVEDMKQAKFAPFIVNGQPVMGKVKIPIQYDHTPDMPASCYALRDSLQE
ncbi:energy transducer TonB [Psychrobacter sp. I-STPA10]|uniref:energy transducer TonB n=1 Tax=Psychrobacter sp. I-STPA10 TaxID=2585769 RepID=UPI001E616329|nr:energy transducer TonB [Psychrobacter sp. I-STPA10]